MKRLLLFGILIALTMILFACDKNDEQEEGEVFAVNFYHMSTFIAVRMKLANEEVKDIHSAEIDRIFSFYHDISTGYDPLPVDSEILTNIYEINLNPEKDIEIDVELYELLEKAQLYKDLTWGYFDISIGHIIDAWKHIVIDEEFGYLFSEIEEEDFEMTLNKIEHITVEEEPFEIWEDEGKYYVRLKSDHVKLDLGALSKGVATQRAADYLIASGVKYFSISTGSSSIVLGENINRLDEDGIFYIGLANPLRVPGNFQEQPTYGMIYVKNTSVTTSGNYEQFATYQGYRYHHIVSPKTKMPMQYYHTVTVIGQNASLLDALSTALFSMNPETFDEWMTMYQEALNIEIVRYNQDETITTYLLNTEFRDRR
jgi:FAD:protein FMN transferase